MKIMIIGVCAAALCASAERSFTIETVVQAPADEAFLAWTDCERIKRFFAPACEIDAREGGAFTMLMSPEKDPVGNTFGSRGARILRFERDRALHFQWRGRPEFKAMNTRPLPTWVELEFFPLSKDKTIVRLTHRGFGVGEEFDDGFHYFSNAWRIVLRRMEKLYQPN